MQTFRCTVRRSRFLPQAKIPKRSFGADEVGGCASVRLAGSNYFQSFVSSHINRNALPIKMPATASAARAVFITMLRVFILHIVGFFLQKQLISAITLPSSKKFFISFLHCKGDRLQSVRLRLQFVLVLLPYRFSCSADSVYEIYMLSADLQATEYYPQV